MKQFDRLCEASSDKATVDISSRFDGVIKSLGCEAGSKMKVGDVLVEFEGEDGDGSNKKQEGEENKKPTVMEAVEGLKQKSVVVESEKKEIFATPAVRHIAKENAINLANVHATGKVR